MRVAHVITDLEVGGAQVMLRRLVGRLQASGVQTSVISLSRVEGRYPELTELGIPVHCLGMRPNRPSPRAFFHLRRLLLAFRPDVIHTWMYHADLLGGLAACLPRVAPVVWGIHHTPCRLKQLKLITRFIVQVNRALSSFVPARIVCCAHASRAAHDTLGYAASRMMVISNGFDTDMFRPDLTARASLRLELGLVGDTPLVGLMARFHPQKDHRTFVLAASSLIRRFPSVHFVLAGRGVDDSCSSLRTWIEATGAPGHFHLLGPRDDMSRLMAACDIVSTSSAHGEGLPLVLGEAMSCGVPCVATDVGDSRLIVGDTGRVVAPDDAEALAAAWRSILTLTKPERDQLGQRARDRVLTRYPLTTYVESHLALYEELSRGGNGVRRL